MPRLSVLFNVFSSVCCPNNAEMGVYCAVFVCRYVGSVSRFFNHSCDPNIRPCKVIISGVRIVHSIIIVFLFYVENL
jgi:hypothetical protein